MNNKYANKHFYYRYIEVWLYHSLLTILFSSSGMFTRAALTAIDWNSNLNREQVSFVFGFSESICRYFQARTQAGQLKYDLVSNRAGNKWFVKSVMEEKDHSWRDATAELVLQVRIKEEEMVTKLRFCFSECLTEKMSTM